MTLQVLVADDGSAATLALATMMSREGCAVRTARDPEAALAAAAASPPDVVVLDAVLGGRDGFELCRRLRAEPLMAGVKIVMLSARCGEIDAEKAMALGADALVAKPFSCRELSARLRALGADVHA